MTVQNWRPMARCMGMLVVALWVAGAAAPDAKHGRGRPESPRTAGGDPIPVPTTKLDFFRGGSQPSELYELNPFRHSQMCGACHGTDNDAIPISRPWGGSMHAMSGRDPLMYACMAIAEQDAPFVGDMCIRCHVPRAWIVGRSEPTDGSAILPTDRDGVNCHICHRMVDPFYKPGESPEEDEDILEDIEELPVSNGSASFVLDPLDRRRGKRGEGGPHPPGVRSTFFEESAICETCHDVSNPTRDRNPDDTYPGNPFDEPHPTGDKYHMFPLERTFSEWLRSEFATTGVDMGGRFGGNKQIVGTCQDCHMPDTTARSADGAPIRDDTADHGMYGGGTWIPLLVANLYPDEVDEDVLLAGIEGSRSMLERAASLEVTQSGDEINARVINETGHKLHTGQAEGRLIWVNVQFFDDDEQMIAERGAYDEETASPARDTEVYELILGMDQETADAVGLPVGPTHHIAFCNVIYKDNRIPPRGFTNEAYRQIQSPVVGVYYADGQYWDDTPYVLPMDATQVKVSVYYKTAATDFIEFLRDANYTNDAGQILYDQWLITGKSPPVLMISETLDLEPFATGDFNGDGEVDLLDYQSFWECRTGPNGGPVPPECEPADLEGDDDVDLLDFARFQRRFGT